jgi:hypothetical protein
MGNKATKQLQKENKELKERNALLLTNAQVVQENEKEHYQQVALSMLKGGVNKEKIEMIVEEFLKKENGNIAILPDSIEKAIYVKLILLVLGILDNVLDNVSLNVMGSQLKMVLTH